MKISFRFAPPALSLTQHVRVGLFFLGSMLYRFVVRNTGGPVDALSCSVSNDTWKKCIALAGSIHAYKHAREVSSLVVRKVQWAVTLKYFARKVRVFGYRPQNRERAKKYKRLCLFT